MAKKQKIEVEENEATYKLTLTLGDKVYKVEGEDVVEMLLSIKPDVLKTKGVFTLVCGNKKAQEVRVLHLTRKILADKENAIFFAKYLVERLK